MVELLFDVEEGVAVQSDMRVVNTGPAKSVSQVWSLNFLDWIYSQTKGPPWTQITRQGGCK